MRREMTEPETRLWLQLRAKRFADVKFRRQKVIQNEQNRYIVDFAANDPKLVIELDGDTHAEREAYDVARTKFLEAEGYSVVRFLNSDVMVNMDGVLTKLAEIVAELQTQPPLPTLSPEGERASERQASLSPSGERGIH
jgi:very-short-patch-repair endonuclease